MRLFSSVPQLLRPQMAGHPEEQTICLHEWEYHLLHQNGLKRRDARCEEVASASRDNP